MWTELFYVIVIVILLLIYNLQRLKSKDAYMKHAMKATKLTDFGIESNPKFFEALDVTLAEIPTANLKILGKIYINFLLRRRLEERLKLVNYVKLNPQLENIQIKSPVFIVGLPRVGSTLLFNLLALEKNVQTLKFWELCSPIPPPFDAVPYEKRIKMIGYALKFQKFFSPELDKIHYMEANEPEEETLWFSQNNWFPGLTIGTATDNLTEWFLSQEDKTGEKGLPMYSDFRNILRMRQKETEAGPPRWLFKGVLIHLHMLPTILRVFPDARIIYLRRDPIEVAASAASLETEMGRHFQYIDEKKHLVKRMPFLIKLEESFKNWRRTLSPEVEKDQFLALYYKDICQNPIDTVKKIYAHFKFDLTEEYLTKLTKYIKENPQHKRGKHNYNLKKFGVTEEHVLKAFEQVYKEDDMKEKVK